MPKHRTQCPWLNLTNLGGLTHQSNEKADKEIKIVEVDVQFVDFPFFLMLGPVRKEMQFRQWGDFSIITLSLQEVIASISGLDD